MRRRISLLLAAALAGTTLMLFGPAQPASATQVCAIAAATATVNPGLLYPVLLSVLDPSLDHTVDILVFNQTNVVHSFTFTDIGGAAVCVHSTTVGGLNANGILKGYCGHSSGTGTINGAPFSYVSAGTFLLLTGHLVGVTNAIPVPLTGSCLHAAVAGTTTFGLPGGATQFRLIAGAGVSLNCLNSLPPMGTLVTVPDVLLLPTQTVGVHVGPYVTHIWTTGSCVPQPLDHLPPIL